MLKRSAGCDRNFRGESIPSAPVGRNQPHHHAIFRVFDRLEPDPDNAAAGDKRRPGRSDEPASLRHIAAEDVEPEREVVDRKGHPAHGEVGMPEALPVEGAPDGEVHFPDHPPDRRPVYALARDPHHSRQVLGVGREFVEGLEALGEGCLVLAGEAGG